VDFDKKGRHQQLQCRARDIRHRDLESGRRMIRRLSRQKVVAVLNGSFAAVVGIRRRALALLTAIRSLLIELSTSEAVEGPNEQKDC